MSQPKNVFRAVYRELSEDEKKTMNNIKNKAQELYDLIEATMPENPSPKGRYVSLSKTALEESVMWAVKGITL